MTYQDKLNDILVKQSQNELFYSGDVSGGAQILVKQIIEGMCVDRASIWMYTNERDSIVLQQLYIAAENRFYQDLRLHKKDFAPYFEYLEEDSTIVADDAETHPATSCFLEGYLKPLGVKSMLDVPIWYKGITIGVVCIESLTPRKWLSEEVNFAQILSSYYSFAYSIRETFDLTRRISETEKFIDKAALISVTDSKGKITYVNEKFTNVSGYTLEEALGKDHSIVNSGLQPDGYWGKMYETVLSGEVWNDVVANRAKDGSIYYVDTYIRARFDSDGNLEGFSSVRQDVTEIVKTNDKLNSIVASQTSYVLRTDMQGKHTYWNQKFEDEFGWVYDGNMMHGNSLLSICESHHGAAYNAVKECVSSPGKIVKVELDKPHRDGSRRTTLWEFVCLTDESGQPLEVQCMGIDITERVEAEKNIIKILHELERKNVYLEHAAKILRHDMHSGINTYIPRGVSSLERRLGPESAKELKIEAPIKMIKEGLKHTQKVYKGVYEFTNLVKKDVVLNKTEYDLKFILDDYLNSTAYRANVQMGDLGKCAVNEALFCTAVDNLIRNGLRYNDSSSKIVKIYREGDLLFIEDNGRGLSSSEFKHLSQPYVRKEGQKESGSGLGLNICIAILEEHGFSIDCEKLPEGGTKIKITLSTCGS